MPLLIRACLLDNPSSNFSKSLMLVACLVCITCSSAPDVSNFRLTGNSLCGHPACSLRQWGCSGEGAPAPVNYQLINSGSFLLVLVSACKRLLVCGIGGRHCDYGIRKKKNTAIFSFPESNIQHPVLCTHAVYGDNICYLIFRRLYSAIYSICKLIFFF